MAKKTDQFKIHHKLKENFSAFSESKFSEIVNTRSKWYSGAFEPMHSALVHKLSIVAQQQLLSPHIHPN
jgi:hypothetical protein